MPQEQSANRKGHSTETAIMKIYNDIVDAIAEGRVALLSLLDLSSAFDTVDHEILVRRLSTSYGVNGRVLSWIEDYLKGRTQSVSWDCSTSALRPVLSGVPQGSVLGPLLFVLYVADVARIIGAHGLSSHAYADDCQIYSSCSPSDSATLRTAMSDCIGGVKHWMAVNRLSLNSSKTEFMWLSTPRRRHLISHTALIVEGVEIAPTTELRLLGVLLDESLSLVGHISSVTRSCYYHLRKIRDIRRYLPTSTVVRLVLALVLARADYCNSILLGLPDSQLRRLQSVLNASARMIYGAGREEHTTSFLKKLHWLRIPERIIYKRCLLTFRALHDPSCPDYLSSLLHRPANQESRRHLRSDNRLQLVVPPPAKTPKFGDRSFSRGNPQLWNLLPEDVVNETTAESFAKRLKTHLFNISFN